MLRRVPNVSWHEEHGRCRAPRAFASRAGEDADRLQSRWQKGKLVVKLTPRARPRKPAQPEDDA
eukprot:6258731-Heterocapsa_arctica.AAC.1